MGGGGLGRNVQISVVKTASRARMESFLENVVIVTHVTSVRQAWSPLAW